MLTIQGFTRWARKPCTLMSGQDASPTNDGEAASLGRCWFISSLVHLAPEGRQVYSTQDKQITQAPAGRQVYRQGKISEE